MIPTDRIVLRSKWKMSMQMPCKLESAVHALGITINRGWLLWFGVVREGFILLRSFRTNILKCKWKWEAEAHILYVFLDAGLWDVAYFLQPTPSPGESARAWTLCPDQLDMNRILPEMGLTGAQGHAKPKGRGLVIILSEPHIPSRQRLLTDLPGGSQEGTVVCCWPFRGVFFIHWGLWCMVTRLLVVSRGQCLETVPLISSWEQDNPSPSPYSFLLRWGFTVDSSM